ncbi:MAG: flippase [Patescibacteria group bacterium]
MTVLIGIVSMALITRTLGTEQFGEYTTALTFLQFFAVLIDFGLALTIIVMISEVNVDIERVVGNFFGLRLLSSCILFSLAPITVLLFPWSDTIKQAVFIGAFAYVLMGSATMLNGIFQRFECVWRSSLAELLNRIVLVFLIVCFAYLHLGVVAFVSASIISNLVWLFCMISFAKPYVRIRPLFEKKIWGQILSRSWPIALSILFNLMYLKGDLLLLAYFRTQSEVGLYGSAYRIIDVLTVIPHLFMGLLIPSLVFAWSTGNKEQFHKKLSRTFDFFMMIAIPIMVGTQLCGVKLLEFISGKEFTGGGEILKILILAVIGIFIGTLFGYLVVSLHKQRVMIFGYATAAILTLIGYLYFIPIYGMQGAAWMTVFSETFIALATFAVVYHTVRATPSLTIFLKSCLAALFMYVFLRIIPEWHVVFQILIGGIAYLSVLVLVKALRPKDLHILFPKKLPS